MAKNVLVVGFEPFGGEKVNPSDMVARALEGRLIAGRALVVRVLPIETRTLRERFELILREADPDIIVAMMQFGGRPALSLERVAINVLDFEHGDNQGIHRKGDAISRGGAEARLSNFPFERILESWRANGVPGCVSNSAGTFIGNQALYELLGLTENAVPPVLCGLVHLPYLPAQAINVGADSTPSMSFDLMKKGLELLIEAVVPWAEQRTPDAIKTRDKGKQMWIPRGVKEVER